MHEILAVGLCLVQLYATGTLMLIGFAWMLGGPGLAGRAGTATLQPVIALASITLQAIASLATLIWQVLGRVVAAVLVHAVDPLLVGLRRLLAAVLFPRR